MQVSWILVIVLSIIVAGLIGTVGWLVAAPSDDTEKLPEQFGQKSDVPSRLKSDGQDQVLEGDLDTYTTVYDPSLTRNPLPNISSIATNHLLQEQLSLFLPLLKKLNASKVPVFASSGTLLGVFRHQGVIPWDTDIDLAILEHDLPLVFEFLDEHKEYYLFGVPCSDMLNRYHVTPSNFWEHEELKPCYDHRISSLEQLYRLDHDKCNLWIMQTSDTTRHIPVVADLELFRHIDTMVPAWQDALTLEEQNKGCYVYGIHEYYMLAGGKLNIPAIFTESFIRHTFYDTTILVFRDSLRYLEQRFGATCFTHYPSIYRKNTGSVRIHDFSPLPLSPLPP